MEKQKVDLFLAANAEKFQPETLLIVEKKLEQMDDDKFLSLQATEFRNPTLILVIAILLGWDRFFLDDVGMGVLKLVTCQGLGIWWIVDILSAKKRAQEYNMKKFETLTLL